MTRRAVVFLTLVCLILSSLSLQLSSKAFAEGAKTFTVAPSTTTPGNHVVCLDKASEEDIDEMSSHLNRYPNDKIQNDDGTWYACWTVPHGEMVSFIVKARGMGYKWQPLEGVPDAPDPANSKPPKITPETQTTGSTESCNASWSVTVPQSPEGPTLLQFEYGDGASAPLNTIPEGTATSTFAYSHKFSSCETGVAGDGGLTPIQKATVATTYAAIIAGSTAFAITVIRSPGPHPLPSSGGDGQNLGPKDTCSTVYHGIFGYSDEVGHPTHEAYCNGFVVTPNAGRGGPIIVAGTFSCGDPKAQVTVCPGLGTGPLLRSTNSVPMGYQYDWCGATTQIGPGLNPLYAQDGCKPIYGGISGGDPALTNAPRCVDSNTCLHLVTNNLRSYSAQQCGPAATSSLIGEVVYTGTGSVVGSGMIPPTLAPGVYEICIPQRGALFATPEDATMIGASYATPYNVYGYYVVN